MMQVLSVFIIFIFSCAYGFEELFNSDLESLSTLALSITDLEEINNDLGVIDTDEFPLRLFPELRFTNNESSGKTFCFSSILDTEEICGNRKENFTLQVWRSNASLSYEMVFTFELLNCDRNLDRRMVCVCQYHAPCAIKRGDILGILHNTEKSVLLYKLNFGLQVFREEGNKTNIELSSSASSAAQNEYPLIAMESDLIQGLLSHRMLEDLMLTVVQSESNSHVIDVMCSGTIKSLYIGGIFLNNKSGSVITLTLGCREVEICSGMRTMMVDFNDIECTDSPNVYKVAIPEWRVQPGDDLEILEIMFDQDKFLLYETSEEKVGVCGTDTTTKTIPLMSIEFSATSIDNGCGDDILYNFETLANRALLIQNANSHEDDDNQGILYILPSMLLTKASSIHQWRFAAKVINSDEALYYPSLQVWRKRGDNLVPISSTDSLQAPLTILGELNIYYYDIDFVYQPGDVVVVYQHPSSRLAVAFVDMIGLYDPTHVVYVQDNNLSSIINADSPFKSDLQRIRLLINLDLTELEDESTLPVDSTSPSPFIPVTEARSSGEFIFIATGVVGGIIVILALIIIIIILIICTRYRKNRKSYKTSDSKEHEVGEEAIYAVIEPKSKSVEDTTSSSNANVIYHTIGPVHAYQQPDARKMNPTAPIAYETPIINNKANLKKEPQETTNHYHILEAPSPPVPTGLAAIQSSVVTGDGNGHIYQVLERPCIQGGAEKKIDTLKAVESFYVPTQKERSNLNNSNDVYRSLRENQALSPTSETAFFEESKEFWAPESDTSKIYEQLAKKKYREIPRNAVQRTVRFGAGEFGTVYQGLWKRLDGLEIEIAIKILKKDICERDKVRFLQEGAINGQFQHPNIVKLFGMVTVGDPIMIIQELLPKGDLGAYLNNHRSKISRKDDSSKWPRLLLQFCQDIVSGMVYLSKKGFVHRDLAARNVLLTEKLNCKVTDFGMSRDLEEGNHYISHGGLIPVRWTAPEALSYSMYSTASDVWSFGVVMHEIWSFGSKPYAKYKNTRVVKLVEAGHRLKPPPGCPKEVYLMMMKCWHPDSSFRPSFDSLLCELIKLEKELLLPQDQEVGLGEEQEEGIDRFTDLGRSLEHGKDLYTELQRIYLTENQQIS